MSDLAINQVRADTPGCPLVLHFHTAAAALPPNAVVTAMKEHLDLEATTGGYEAAALHLSQSEKMYVNAARLIHCKPEEIAFVDNATRA